MTSKYIQIKVQGGGTYIQPADKLADALDGDLDGVEIGETLTIEFTPIEMTDEEYAELPDFAGH